MQVKILNIMDYYKLKFTKSNTVIYNISVKMLIANYIKFIN